jgi:hypothetical protein
LLEILNSAQEFATEAKMLLNFSIVQIVVSSVVVAAAVVLSTGVKYVLASRRPKGFPRGPDTVPLLGNLHQLPTSKAFLK